MKFSSVGSAEPVAVIHRQFVIEVWCVLLRFFMGLATTAIVRCVAASLQGAAPISHFCGSRRKWWPPLMLGFFQILRHGIYSTMRRPSAPRVSTGFRVVAWTAQSRSKDAAA
jgi:hypothetical protein